MNCHEFQDWLQKLLDDGANYCPPEAAAHVAECAPCRELHSAARQLMNGLTALPRPQAAPLLTQSIVAGVLEERRLRLRRVRQRVAVTFGLAAAILLLMLVGWLNQAPPIDKHKFAEPPRPAPAPAVPKFAERADEARGAVAQLTERVADETKQQAKLLMTVANSFDLPPMGSLPGLNELDVPLDPAAQSLRNATETVASGIEPITNSARRAFTFFVREMPVFDIPSKN